MPHLMFETFMSQWIWLTILLFGLYFVLITVLLPKISNSFKARKNLESGDLGHSALSAPKADLALDLTNPKVSSPVSYSSTFSKNFSAWSATL